MDYEIFGKRSRNGGCGIPWHGKIYIIGTLRNVPFEKDSESMINSSGHVGTVEIIEVRSQRKKIKDNLKMRGNMN